ncbi:MAG: tRNA (adenosine(37)-N6)-threonylcarbamoyltransferase complex dimerization subunit type 1 TsaB [Bacteroidia bacterium]|nr:tRNA (adenosine(37)-N6)-threonylcarbamoyltransferase complex dimerization subunit type 1 TsaB [Bacteroidia bacterium]
MAYILHIETATTVCSVALSQNEKTLFVKELDEGFTHAENLHLFIQEALSKTGIESKDLNAISVSKGPGSYTGLRIGVSSAKGLAYALNIPLISVDTLQIMAAMAYDTMKEKAFYCPMIDARRMEIYTNVYDQDLKAQSEIQALIVDENSIDTFKKYPKICFFGDGMPKCKTLLSTLTNAHFIEDIKPSAASMVKLAHAKFVSKSFEDVAYFEPFYLKDFMITKSKSAK